MLKKGMLIQVKTTTKDNVFGEVVYELEDIGMKTADGVNDGVRAVMLGGNGPCARKGVVILDNERVINQNIKTGITKIIPDAKASSIRSFYNK